MDTGLFRGLKPLRRTLGTATIIVVAGTAAAGAGDIAGHRASVSNFSLRGSVETVYFGEEQQRSVKVVRGTDVAGGLRMRRDVMTFGGGTAQQVVVFRGIVEPSSVSAPPEETADRARPSATMLRGGMTLRGLSPADLFGPADEEQLGRIAEAVHGVESRYGTDLRMWRLDNLSGPQGPMQVSAAAAFDVGGGNRFDIYENLLLGRAYLARLFRRFGNWSDTLAAYNWGPGNVDQWIARGRNTAQLPGETTRYIERVLRKAFGSTAGIAEQRVSKR